MMEHTLTIPYSEELLTALGVTALEAEARLLIAVKLFEMG
jgi:hypothetical protein